MKKHTLLLSAIILFFAFPGSCLKAQITITQSDLPSIGSKAKMAVDMTGVLSPQSASNTAQIWNYSTLQNTQTNAYLFVNPASTIYFPAFPSSNLADSLIYGSGDTYFSSTPTYFSAMGYGEVMDGYAIGITIRPYFEQISFPGTYGTIDGGVSKGDTSLAINYATFDSGRAVINIHYADTVDAFGTMTTPFGTDTVIRQKHYDLTIDSLFVHSHIFGWKLYQAATTKDYMYRWYAKGLGYYFAIMQMDHTNTKDSVVQWFTNANAGVNNIDNSKYTAVYPNPCKTEITFNCSSPDARQISVFDITGRQIAAEEIKNGMLIMNTSAYHEGMYFYRVSDASENVVDRGKFIVQ